MFRFNRHHQGAY